MNCPKCGALMVDPFYMVLGQGLCYSCLEVVTIMDAPNELDKRKEDQQNDNDEQDY